jgi:iron complex outermembrane receptor protein
VLQKIVILSTLCSSLLLSSELSPITIEGEYEANPTEQALNPLKERFEVPLRGIELFGDKAQTSTFKVLDLEPGFIVETQDSYGLSQTKAKARGVDSNFMSVNLEGIPSYSIRPIGPRDGIYDLENMEKIEHYNGALNPDAGGGVGNKAGLVDMKVRYSSDTPSALVATTFGEDSFYKVFARADSGLIGEYFKGFFSFSQANGEKWKGKGDLGEKNTFTLELNYLKESFPLTILFSHSEQKRYDFKGLSYAQIQNLDTNYNVDYDTSNSNSSDYYEYHQQDLKYDDLQLSTKNNCFGGECSLKLYGSKYLEKSEEGDGRGTVDGKRVGLMLSNKKSFDSFSGELGLWTELAWLEKYVEKVSTTPDRTHTGWKWLNKNDDSPTQLFSPYVSAYKEFDRLKVETGLRYMYYKESANDTYLGNNAYSDYDTAIANGTIAPGGHVDSLEYSMLLPTLGARFEIDEDTEIFGKWGRGYQRPYRYSFAAQYAANKNGIRTALLAAGKDLNYIFQSWEMETSDLFDIGIRRYFDFGEVSVSAFYNLHHDLLSTAYDSALGIDYLQNVGEAVVYGLQVQSSIKATDNLWFAFNPALTFSRVTKDMVYNNANYSIKGNEIAETPKFSLKVAATYSLKNHLLSLQGRYIGSRYADIENTEKMDAYTTWDASYGYGFKNIGFAKTLDITLSLNNIFDEKYVSSIGTADLLDDTTTYYVGAPRSVALSFKGTF